MVRAGGGRQVTLIFGGFVSQLGEDVGRVTVAAAGQAPQLVHVAFFRGELNELVHSVTAAAVGKPPQLLEILPLAGKFDEFPDGVGVTLRGPFAQGVQIRIGHFYDLPWS